MTTPTLYGIGVGPGDPELLTVKAVRCIGASELVFVPISRTGATSLAERIAEPYLDRTRQRVITLEYPTDGRAQSELAAYWDASADTIATMLGLKGTGAFLTEGDPMLFSTFMYTMEALHTRHHSIHIQIVPGVTSITAAAAASGIPLARNDERVTLLPATAPEPELRSALRASDTTVLMKLGGPADRILNILGQEDLLAHAVWIRRCGQPDQEIVRDVRALAGRRLDYFSLMIVKRPSN
jgi:precorrin-2/cobalt-factor-2 C20-methyltransferase